MHIKSVLFYCLLSIFLSCLIQAQSSKYSASAIQHDLKKLNSVGSVLYVAAHPDDENTRLIAYLANEALLNTGYLSVTRGDGGQNLVGSEIREMLGVIRTQELLQARRIDGGQQFFTRAKDFGYSKNPEETLKVWDKEKVLADVVWVIRKFQPDVIITRFPTDGRGGHGHHTASAILAEEAFDAAADPNRFPNQLQYVKPWQPRSLLFNTHLWFRGSQEDFDTTNLISVDVGRYNSLLGKSYTEIAAESRSMHKSQGFGAIGTRGSEIEYLKHVKGEELPVDFFDGPVRKWSSIEGTEKFVGLASEAYGSFNPEEPEAIIPVLLKARNALELVNDPYWKQVKKIQLNQLIKSTLGLYLEASTSYASSTPGDSVKVRLEVTNRSKIPVAIESIDIAGDVPDINGSSVGFNQRFEKHVTIAIGINQSYTQPYWLEDQGSIGMFKVDDQQLIGLPENNPAILVNMEINILGQTVSYEVPLIYKRTDPVKGEVRQPFSITPPVTVSFHEKVQVFADDGARKVHLTVKSGKDYVRGILKLDAPGGWQISPSEVPITLEQQGEEQQVEFVIQPPSNPDESEITASLTVDGQSYGLEKVTIEYDHIPNQVLLPEASIKVVKLNIVAGGRNVGYIMGAGDEIPSSLRQIGYSVDLIDLDNIASEQLKDFDVIILGIRALNTVDRLKYQMPDLLNYVEQGGTLIVQYNTTRRMITQDFAPYNIKLSRERVSVEEAPVKFLLPDHDLLNFPNKITPRDFEGWVQERGLYFPNEWDRKYQAILEIDEPGESPKQGGLLVAGYGKGYYIYTGLSWFRELPAGVPGAYRIFANMVSLGQQEPEN